MTLIVSTHSSLHEPSLDRKLLLSLKAFTFVPNFYQIFHIDTMPPFNFISSKKQIYRYVVSTYVLLFKMIKIILPVIYVYVYKFQINIFFNFIILKIIQLTLQGSNFFLCYICHIYPIINLVLKPRIYLVILDNVALATTPTTF